MKDFLANLALVLVLALFAGLLVITLASYLSQPIAGH